MSNTLLNYFSKSPAVSSNKTSSKEPVTPKGNVSGPKFTPKSSTKKKKNSDGSGPAAKKAKTGESTPKSSHKKKSKENKTPNGINSSNDSVEQEEEDEFENSPDGSGKKRKRLLLLESDGSEDEYKPDSGHESSESEVSADESSESESNVETEDEPTPKKDKKKKVASNKKSASAKKVAKKLEGSFLTPNKPKLHSSAESSFTGVEGQIPGQDRTDSWPHLKLEFLKPDKIRDIKNRRPTDPDYDPRTLRIPEDFKKSLTPAHKQWWDMKATHFDCVLFFKVGKFYELFHMDAVIGVNELNLTYMKGEFAHSGFPEIAYGRFSTTLVEKGYKVARIEQTETPDMMEKRCKTLPKVTKFDKVVNREICQITTKGTRVYSIVDGDTSQAEAQFLLAICEKKFDTGGSAYGVCFIDTSIGIFHIGQFIDDKQCSRLRTLIAHYPPAQILFERGHISKKTQQLLNVTLSAVLKDALLPDTEFWTSSKTLLQLMECNYFEKDSMPEKLKKFVGETDSLGLTASEDGELAIRSLGAVTWYLRRCQLDHQLLGMEKFSIYLPVDSEEYVGDSEKTDCSTKRMVLDAVTLKNLHVLENSCGGIEGTLLHKLDNCNTAFGKRLLYQWICSPLFNIKGIIDRQKAISTLIENSHVMEELRPLLNQLPDLERMLSRIFAQSTFGLDPSHPENRAIMFEEKTYSKKRIVEFTNVLSGFQNAQKISEVLQESGICDDCDLLRQCSHFPTNTHPGKFPDLSSHLNFFKNAFDHDEALKEGRIIPSAGVDSEYDSAIEALHEIDVESKEYLKEQCKFFCAKVTYVGTDKKRFQLEVPEAACKRAGNEYEIQGQKKGYKRFWTPKCRELLEKQIAAEDLKTSVLKDLRRRIFSRFSERMDDWRAAVQCLSVIDVLLSLADYSRGQDCDISVPKFEYFIENGVDDNSLAVVNVQSGRFPCSTGDEVFIPNDTVIGEQGSSLVLVTGPNMGGKSTLMRQLGLIVILAQMGCHVPAISVFLNPVDRIFTRLGANDDIMSGESTFYMELSETSAILKHSTKHSLVLIDELGRGTSTYDGTAIAASVLNELTSMKCRTLFSTHYHSLVEDFKHFKTVKLGHMSCMAETEEDVEGSNKETVTFLYKFAEGACPKSYGFNAARLAGVPNDIIKLGQQHSKQLEHESMQRKLFKILFSKQQNIKLREKLAEIS